MNKGRPPFADRSLVRSEIVAFRVTPDTRARLDRWHVRQRETYSDLLNDLVLDFLDEYEEANRREA